MLRLDCRAPRAEEVTGKQTAAAGEGLGHGAWAREGEGLARGPSTGSVAETARSSPPSPHDAVVNHHGAESSLLSVTSLCVLLKSSAALNTGNRLYLAVDPQFFSSGLSPVSS